MQPMIATLAMYAKCGQAVRRGKLLSQRAQEVEALALRAIVSWLSAMNRPRTVAGGG
jgi:hypothetical protein